MPESDNVFGGDPPKKEEPKVEVNPLDIPIPELGGKTQRQVAIESEQTNQVIRKAQEDAERARQEELKRQQPQNPYEELDKQFFDTPAKAAQQVATQTIAPALLEQDQRWAHKNYSDMIASIQDPEVKKVCDDWIAAAMRTPNGQAEAIKYLADVNKVQNAVKIAHDQIDLQRRREKDRREAEEAGEETAPVSVPFTSGPSIKTTVEAPARRARLTDEEKEAARAMGTTEEEYNAFKNVKVGFFNSVSYDEIMRAGEAEERRKAGKK